MLHHYTVITHRRKLINQSVFAPNLDGSEWFGKDAMQAKKHTCKKKKCPIAENNKLSRIALI